MGHAARTARAQGLVAVRRVSAAARARLALAAAALAAGCASPGLPPGGPPDENPPVVVRVVPDTGRVNVRPRRVVFQFDEVVNERPQGAVSLAGLFLVSPRDGEPDVDWDRDAVTIRPRRGFRANTVYTVTMLPGISDLRGNVRKEGARTVFSTGPTIFAGRVSGVVFDWVRGAVQANSLVEAISRPDSVVFVTVADSAGRFTLTHLAPGSYTVRAVADANNNRTLDPREAWDSVAVTLRDSARVELLAFVHDSVAPGIGNVTVADSVTLRVALDRPLDPSQRLEPSLFTLRGADSLPVPITAVRTAAAHDSAAAAAEGAPAAPGAPRAGQPPGARPPAAAQPGAPGARRTDTLAAAPRPSRPAPPTELVLRLGRTLRPDTPFRLESAGLRGLLGTTRASARVFTTPKPTAAAPDSAGRRDPGALRVVPDPVVPPRPPTRADSARPPARPPR